jgi:hypothetical protein
MHESLPAGEAGIEALTKPNIRAPSLSWRMDFDYGKYSFRPPIPSLDNQLNEFRVSQIRKAILLHLWDKFYYHYFLPTSGG